MKMLAHIPATSRIAVLILESQRLVEAVNKHASVASLLQTCESGHDHQNSVLTETPSGHKCAQTNRERENHTFLSNENLAGQFDRLVRRSELAGQARLHSSPVIALEHKNLRDLIKPYSYTTDDIIIRKSKPVSVFDPKTLASLKQKKNVKFTVNRKESVYACGSDFDIGRLRHVKTIDVGQEALNSVKRMKAKLSISSTLLYSDLPQGSEWSTSPSESPAPNRGGPNSDQLVLIQDHFASALPKFFIQKHDFRVYHADIVFENNYWGTNIVTKGLSSYIVQLNKLRILSLLKFAHTQMEVLKITTHEGDGTVRIRWRMKGLSQLKALQFWKFLPWRYRKSVKDELTWYDGFSILHIGKDGLVHKHRLDRVMPDEETETVKSGNLAIKLGLLLGLAPKPSLNDFVSLLYKKIAPRSALSGQQ